MDDPFSEFPDARPESHSDQRQEQKSAPPERLISIAPPSLGWAHWTTRQRLLTVTVIAFLAIAATAAALFIFGQNSFDPDRVRIDIDLPQEIVSGSEAVFDVTVVNENSVHLEDAEFIFTFPQGALQLDDRGRESEADPVRLSINRIHAGGEVRYSFAARLLGDPEASQFAEASLRYRPSSINAQFESRQQTVVRVERSPIEISVEAPKKAISGEEVVYRVQYTVAQPIEFSVARVVLEYPDGFQFSGGDPDPVDGTENQWEFRNLVEGDEEEFVVRGSLDGVTGQVKRLRVSVGEYRGATFIPFTRTEKSTIIDTHPLVVDIDVEGAPSGSADIGTILNYTIVFKNNSDIALRELILRARPIGGVFDIRSISAKGATFREGGELLEWTAPSIPQLALFAPGEEARVSFTAPLKKSFPIVSSGDKNFKALVEVELETPTVPESFASDRLRRTVTSEVKVNSNPTLQQIVFYNETSSSITNSGPHPPRVGERTTYTVHWRLLNAGNDLSNVVVRSTLPSGIDWTGRTATAFSQTQLRFNDRTREIIWDVGDVPATTGIIFPTYEVVFQVALTPSPQQEGDRPTIAAAVRAEAVDTFTGAFLEVSDTAVATDLPDDPAAGGAGRVE